jgi:exo-beta-1,3-glucanase (GH17 family)
MRAYSERKTLQIKIKDGNPSIKSTRQMRTQVNTIQRKKKSIKVISLEMSTLALKRIVEITHSQSLIVQKYLENGIGVVRI